VVGSKNRISFVQFVVVLLFRVIKLDLYIETLPSRESLYSSVCVKLSCFQLVMKHETAKWDWATQLLSGNGHLPLTRDKIPVCVLLSLVLVFVLVLISFACLCCGLLSCLVALYCLVLFVRRYVFAVCLSIYLSISLPFVSLLSLLA
jgi:hypothetical protein